VLPLFRQTSPSSANVLYLKLGHNAIAKPWEEARDALVGQLIAGLSNLSAATITMLRCVNTPGSNECACLNYFSEIVQAFQQRRMESMTFHGIVVNFCPRLAQSIFMHSTNSLRSILFSEVMDDYPSLTQPFEHIAQLPHLRHLSLATASFRSHDFGHLNWTCPLEVITVANEAGSQITQPVPTHQLDMFLVNFSSSLHSLVLHDVCVTNPSDSQLTPLPHLIHVTLQSTRDSTFETLDIFRSFDLETLSITIIPAVKHSPLLNALTSGAFPGLKQVHIHFKESRNTPVLWNSSATAAVQAACNERAIELIVTEDKRQKVGHYQLTSDFSKVN
jgi:hypothetical protein